jgi:hypothetical protein
VAKRSRSRKGVHDRGRGRRALEIDRKANCVIWGVLSPGSAIDAEREDLHVQVEAADWAAIQQFKRPSARTVRRAVSKYLRAVRTAGVAAAEAETLSEVELERRVFGPMPEGKAGPLVAPDCAWIHGELKRHRHVTLQRSENRSSFLSIAPRQ